MEKFQRKIFVWIAVFLMLAFYTVFFFFPLSSGLINSFFHWNPLNNQREFAGIENYKNLFTSPIFHVSLKNTLIYVFSVVIGKTLLGLLLALAINALNRLKVVFRSIYFLPVIMPIVAISIIWKWFYHPRVGLLNSLLLGTGLTDSPINWLGNPTLVMPSVIFVTIWKDMGYALIIFVAALLNIPSDLLEAAHIDGAGRTQKLIYITLPSIKPTLIFVVITSLIGDFQSFVQIFIMTKGGPGNASNVISYLIYNQAFVDYKFGYASATSVVLFMIIMVITFIQFNLISKGNNE